MGRPPAGRPRGSKTGPGGREGGPRNDEPGTSRSLKTMPGSWSDQPLACLIQVGMKRLMPDQDSGLGIGPEYEVTLRLHPGGARSSPAAPTSTRPRPRSAIIRIATLRLFGGCEGV